MSECDHAIALDGHEFSLWDQRVECPYCRIAELEEKVERLESMWSFVYRTGDVMDHLSVSAKDRLSIQDVSYVLDAIHRAALEAGDG